MKILNSWMIVACSLAAQVAWPGMEIRVEKATQKYSIFENDSPVLTYNFGTVPVTSGVKGIYAVARGDYVHPLFGPNGEVLTMDYSPDHPHHRGIYWAWPEVTYTSQTRDLHALQGVFARPVRIVGQEAKDNYAEIKAENVWRWDDKEAIVRETAAIRVHRAQDGLRNIDFVLRFEALKPGVQIARRQRNAYGGLNIRMSARADQKIEHPGAEWAEARGVPPDGKEPIGFLILQAPTNPEYPGDWIEFPNLNWLQPTFPAKGKAYDLTSDQPLVLRYRVVIRSGKGLAANPADLAAAYAASLSVPLEAMSGWQMGEDRSALTAIEEKLRGASDSERRAFEQRLLDLLSKQKTSGDFKRWAGKQLVLAGSDAAVSAAAGLLQDDYAWMQAADVLLSRPGDAGLAALREAAPKAEVSRRAALLSLLGMRRDERAIPLLTQQAAAAETSVSIAAIAALGSIASEDAAKALAGLSVSEASRDALWDARLHTADGLSQAGKRVPAQSLYRQVMDDRAAKPWHRGAALRGLAVATPEEAPKLITAGLTGDDPYLFKGAAAALPALDAAALAGLRASWGKFPSRARLALLNAWGAKSVREAGPEILSTLNDTDTDVRGAAMKALRGTGSQRAVDPLLALAAKPGDLSKEAKETLAQLRSDGIAEELRKHARGADAPLAAAALSVMGARRDPGYVDDMLAALDKGAPELARKALSALRDDGAPAHLPALRRRLLAEKNETTQKEVARAIVSICKRQADADACLAGVLGGDPAIEGPARAAMLAALPTLGGKTALDFATRTQDEPTARALLNWTDGTAAAPLLAIAGRASADPKLRSLAVAGYIELIKRALPAAQQAPELQKVMPYLPDDTARKNLRAYLEDSNNQNLALNKPAKSSSAFPPGHLPAHAVDGKKTLASYWETIVPGATLTVDLGAPSRISRVRVTTYWDGKRYYQYLVEASQDNAKWIRAADMTSNTLAATEAGVMHRFDPIEARYVRVAMLKNSANPGLHLVELEVFASGAASKE